MRIASGFNFGGSAPPNIVTRGLVLWLDAGNLNSYSGSGTSWKDISGNGKNGTLVNGPTFNSANGGAIVFDGSNDYTSFSASSDFYMNNRQEYTLEVWAYHGTISGTPPANGYIDRTGSDEYNIYMSPIAKSADIQFVTERRASGVYTQSQFFKTKTDYENKWTHVCGVYDGTNIKIYVDSVAGPTTTSSTSNLTGTGNLEVGRVATSYGPMSGRLAIVRVYNRGLSANEITQNYNAQRGRFGV